ncbi:MAG: DUF3082 domain-containing protein [Nostoc sp. SerVER01]|uniref:DUF3082 domain-containing protein n=1 Tax=Nostoc sp. CCY 9925 TaxID=3103865 RepID=UPI002AD61F26|nr:DUF3082 domain-containing protein [Nostoc sp. SerVER01]MDZ8029096.1 DUF3082 domain-containing protein [Nostoc sp. DedQUE11]MDZ8076496.1 DUF3082 domain-containing protein [Nostoc sp. DedQUE01]MDZ8083791.1 DUF3082 domain-containing protein [Nostoc sp. DcaGUA01]MDZ8236687.1 DUF3082 domain-containing protein [Nostoc sp. ChiQUE01a]
MTDQNLTPKTDAQVEMTGSPLRSIIGSVISGGMAFALYSLMIAIATSFASKPVHSINPLVIKITSAVRTLVVGVVALGSGIFGIVAIGLLALTVQLLVQQLKKPKSSEN